METLEAIARRTSVRSYRKEQVPDEVLDAIVRAGFRAPVASGRYDSLHLAVVQNPELLRQLAQGAAKVVRQAIGVEKDMDFGAPVLVVVSSAPAAMPGIAHANAACVLENMALAAVDQGVDSLIWGGAAAAVAQDAELKGLLGIPEGFEPLLAVSLGYATRPEASKEHAIAVNRV